MATKKRRTTRPDPISEQAEEMAQAIERMRQAEDGGEPLTLLERARGSVATCEMWSLLEKFHQSLGPFTATKVRAIAPILISIVGPYEPHISELFPHTVATVNLRKSRRELEELLRTGITDPREWLIRQVEQQAARNIPRKERGATLTVDWEGEALAGLGIHDGDEVVVVQTPDIREGDLACFDRPAWYQKPDGSVDLGVMKFSPPYELLFEYPDTPDEGAHGEAHEIKFVGRAVAVHRGGKPVDVPFTFRPYEGEA